MVTIVIGVSAQKSEGKQFGITRKDKSEILKQVFADGFQELLKVEQFSICTTPIVGDDQIILIRSVESQIFPKRIGNCRFKFLSERKIEAEIKSNNGDCFFDVGNFQITKDREVQISLWRWIHVITVVNGKSWYPSRWAGATGRVYKATNEKGKWIVKFSNGTAIVT